MSEKVLGFKEKDSLQDNYRNFFDEKVCLVIPKSKLVPVVEVEEHKRKIQVLQNHIAVLNRLMGEKKVSVAWLEKWVDKETEKIKDCGLVDASVHTIILKDLLVAVRREADGKSLVQRHYEQLYPSKKEVGKK